MSNNVSSRDKVADWVTPAELNIDPYPIYDRIRKEGPVMWAPSMNRHLTASYEAGMRVEREPENFTAHEPEGMSTMIRTMRGRPMNRKDDPDHMTDRQEVLPHLKLKAIKKYWNQVFEETSDRFLDALIDAGPGANFMTEFAGPFAADNLRQIIGFSNATHEDVKRWSKDLVDGIANVTDDDDVWARCNRSNDEIEQAIQEITPRLQAEPNGSMLSGLLASDLPMENILANVKLTISGGMNEPQNVVGAGVWALVKDPDQHALVAQGEYDYRSVFEEALRWETPIGMFPRTVTRDMDFFGAHLQEGDKISVLTGAANHDPDVFERPNEFDLQRPKKPHFGFGAGTHMCAGMWIARASVGSVALPKIFDRLDGLDISTEREAYMRGWVFRGLKDLPLTWTNARYSNAK